jgi:putative membrane protein
MKSPDEVIKRWLHPAVFATWTGFLIYLLASQSYAAFLRPEFGVLLALAHFIAMGFMIAAMIRPKAAEIDTPAILRALVLLVPVLYFMAMPDVMLGNQAFKKRFIGTNTGAIGRQAPSVPSSQGSETDSDAAAPTEELEATREEKPQERTILEIFLQPSLYEGQRVVVTGMMLHDEQLEPHFGGRDSALYRFLMTCCAADALPLAIALDSDLADAFANDQWVKVDGIFDLQQINGKPVPIILKPQIEPVEAPAVPYLF